MLPRTLKQLMVAATVCVLSAPAAFSLDVNSAKAHFNAGKAAAAKQDYATALHEFNASVDIVPTSAATYTARGYVFEQIGKWDKALRDYDFALVLEPSFPDALCLRGNLYSKIGKLRDAEQDLQQAALLKPQDANARRLLAQVRQKQGYRPQVRRVSVLEQQKL